MLTTDFRILIVINLPHALVGGFDDYEIAQRCHEPRASVLDCGGAPPLSDASWPSKSARTLAHSKTLRQEVRFMKREAGKLRTERPPVLTQ